jgi:hypothetical protein
MISLNLQRVIARFCAEVRNMLLTPLGSEEPGRHSNFKINSFVFFFFFVFAFVYLSFLFLTGSGCRQRRFFFLRQFGSGPSAT